MLVWVEAARPAPASKSSSGVRGGAVGKKRSYYARTRTGQFAYTGGHRHAAVGSRAPKAFGIAPTKQRAFTGKQVATKITLSKQQAGALGEKIVVANLHAAGFKDAAPLNSKKSNFPVDAVHDHKVIEIKTGLVSNGKSAQQWRATIGQPGKKESVWLKKASPTAKAEWNQKKSEKILERKKAAVASISKEMGLRAKGETVAVIINPDKRIADIYRFSGFHLRIAWNAPATASAYVGSVSYGGG